MKRDTREMLMRIYGDRAEVHLDLHELSLKHRRNHGRDCEMFPSDPLQAPRWTVIASLTHARRALEVGCGHGYTAALIATARPECRVDTIEGNPVHADLAEQAFQQRGLSRRIRVLRGRGQNILPKLKGHYDIVFLDGDWQEYPRYIPDLRRLTHPGSIVVTANLNPLFGGWGGKLPGKRDIESYLTRLVRDPHFRTYVIPGEWESISVRV